MRVLLAPAEVPSNHPKYWDKLQYPLLGSPKIDGIRGVTDDKHKMMSRSWKPIPSVQVQDELTDLAWGDGEIAEGPVTDTGLFNRTQSFVMSEEKFTNRLTYNIFDYAEESWRSTEFWRRLEYAEQLVKAVNNPKILYVPHSAIENREELEAYEETQLALGYEGIMLRTVCGRYKENRATINEGIIYKLKRFEDDEGVVVGFVERLTNNNSQERDERGFAKRSSHKAGKSGAGTLGKFLVEFQGKRINVATGLFTHAELQYIWDNKEKYLGKLLKFRYFSHGVKDEPRHARAIGWRSLIDL